MLCILILYMLLFIQCFILSCCDVHVYLCTPFMFAVVVPAYMYLAELIYNIMYPSTYLMCTNSVLNKSVISYPTSTLQNIICMNMYFIAY